MAKGSKLGRQKRKPANKAYLAERRWIKNKERNKAKALKVKLVKKEA